jgi:catechol 2,3-dioxygenase-like lactoylglutathione lyase family enzyme
MLSSIDHVNLVVADLPRMLAFYRDVLGLTVTKEVTISGDWIGQTVGLTDVRAEVVYLDLPSGPRIELLRYISPDALQAPGVDRPNAIGLRHLAFKVDDIDAVTQRLRAAGVEFFSGVQTVPDAQVTYAGGVRKRLVYFRDPEGNILELCEYR